MIRILLLIAVTYALIRFVLLPVVGPVVGQVCLPVLGGNCPPTVAFSANPVSLKEGEKSLLTWSTDNATEVTIGGNPVQNSGSAEVTLDKTSTFALVAKNEHGETQAAVKINVTTPYASPVPSKASPEPAQPTAVPTQAPASTSTVVPVPTVPVLLPAVPAPGIQYQLGCGDKNVGAVQNKIGLSVVCLGTEYDAYTWRSVPQVVDAILPDGFIGTLHLANDKIVVTQDPGKYPIVAGTFRRKAGYPAGDAVYNACDLLIKEQAFGASQTPSFKVEAQGFSCDNQQTTTSSSVPTQQPAQPTQVPQVSQPATKPAPPTIVPATASKPGNTCLTLSNVSTTIGGNTSSWTVLPNTNGEGLKYNGPAVLLKAPATGRVDTDGATLRNGQTATVASATYWCNG